MNPRQTALVVAAILAAFLLTPTSPMAANPPFYSGYPGYPGELLVSRPTISSADELVKDVELEQIALEVNAYTALDGPGPVDAVDLSRMLADSHAAVWQDPPSEFEYAWVLDGEGNVQRICYVPIVIHVDDDTAAGEVWVTVPVVVVL